MPNQHTRSEPATGIEPATGCLQNRSIRIRLDTTFDTNVGQGASGWRGGSTLWGDIWGAGWKRKGRGNWAFSDSCDI